MFATRIHFDYNNATKETRLKVRFEATDGDEIVYGHGFRLDLADVSSEESNTPLLTETLDKLHSILGLYYSFYSVKQELLELDEEDALYDRKKAALEIELADAIAALRTAIKESTAS